VVNAVAPVQNSWAVPSKGKHRIAKSPSILGEYQNNSEQVLRYL
jgi:hypothetical protein